MPFPSPREPTVAELEEYKATWYKDKVEDWRGLPCRWNTCKGHYENTVAHPWPHREDGNEVVIACDHCGSMELRYARQAAMNATSLDEVKTAWFYDQKRKAVAAFEAKINLNTYYPKTANPVCTFYNPDLARAIAQTGREYAAKLVAGNDALKAYAFFHGTDAILEFEWKYADKPQYQAKGDGLTNKPLKIQKQW